MTFKAKLSKQGNSYCIYVPVKVRTKLDLDKVYEWEVRTEGVKEELGDIFVKSFKGANTSGTAAIWCKKHDVYKGTCGCK